MDVRRRTDGGYDPGVTPALAAIGSGTIPAGLVSPYAGSTAPTGWLLCDGSEYNKEAYGPLFLAIGTTYGETNGAGSAGTTHFRVPDLRQRFPLGKAASGTGATLGGTGGAIDHTHALTAATVSHTHTNTISVATGTTGSSHDHNAGSLVAASHTHAAGSYTTGGPSNTANRNVDAPTGAVASSGHTHDVSGTSGANNADVSGTTGTTGSTHTHNATVSGAIDTTAATITGSSDAANAPFLALNYIIRT